jgi:hypothetical protein
MRLWYDAHHRSDVSFRITYFDTGAASKFRTPLTPELCVLAGRTLHLMIGRIRSKRRR